MQTSFSRPACKTGLLILAIVLLHSTSLCAQGPNFVSFKTSYFEPMPLTPAPVSFVSVAETPRPHRFWDRKNSVLFGAVAAAGAADFYVTHANLASGGRELNPATRLFCGSTAGLALSFTGQTVGVIGASYFFHRTGHHRLERMTALVNIGASSVAAGYSAAHR